MCDLDCQPGLVKKRTLRTRLLSMLSSSQTYDCPMPTMAERIIDALRRAGEPLDDDELARRLGVIRQHVNQACRRLATDGSLVRAPGASGKIVNHLPGSVITPPRPPPPVVSGGLLSEDDVKVAVKQHLEERGYEVVVRWGRERGIDIDARGIDGRWVIEAKGEVALQPQQVNYFIGALGELVQRMDDPEANYGLALPDNRQYRGLVARLPQLAFHRLKLTVFFVRRDNERLRVTVERPS